ncbi:MAG: carboxyl-terminal processing protease [Actinomycetota bacterium]|nr:carboxyl-terminal processing protease [Actinomycetota bacterium]MDQ1641181.1 carboxyl-terminal processing protease [Actinomycetota bacterium]
MVFSSRFLRGVAMVAAVALAYVGGVVTGVVGSGTSRHAAPSGVIDEAAARIADQAAEPVDRKALERAAVEGMLRTLGDRWSTYYEPTEFASFQDALAGHYSGVGLWLRPARGGGVEVGSVQPGSPAARAGVRGGDTMLSVDAHDVALGDLGRVAGLLRGTPGTTVKLVVRRAGTSHTITVKRETFATEDVTIERLQGDIVRLRVSAFTRGVGRDVRHVLATVASRNRGGVVLDLRGNPGGLLDEAVEVASVFLDGGPVVSYERRGKPSRTLTAIRGGDVTTPLVVLVDSGTASAAEVLAAALQDRNRAVVVGARTYGKGSVQEPTRLSDGSALELTVGRYLTPSGRTIDGVGMEPDVLVASTEAPAVAERRAIEVLTGLVAALGATGRG